MKEHPLHTLLSPERSIVRYIIGTATLTVVVQILYDLAKTPPLGIFGGIGLAILLIGVVFLILWYDARHYKSVSRLKPEDEPIIKHRGLIVMVSPKNTVVPLRSVEHHIPLLEHCWLVATVQSQPTAVDIAKEIHERYPDVMVHDPDPADLVDPEYAKSTWQVVEKIYASAHEYDLSEEDIVADITGGLKPMTAGMALACLPLNRTMQYMKTFRDDNGDPIKDAPPAAIQITIQVSEK